MTQANDVVYERHMTSATAILDQDRYAAMFVDSNEAKPMIIYHRGAAFQPSVTQVGNAFVARASILEEDGHATSLGNLGAFASKDGALGFAVRCATAFLDGDDLPLPPFRLTPQ
jgi:hypothetical protein